MWLATCHSDPDAVMEINVRFSRIFDLLEQYGVAIGAPRVSKLQGFANLWEMRVRHPTGAYRLFFGIKASQFGVARGAWKNDDRFAPIVYVRANEAVEAYLETL